MALDASTILCMSQYNKTDIYSLLDESLQHHLVSFSLYQGSPEASFRSLRTASKQSLGEIRRPLDCYGRSVVSEFFAIMPGTKDSYPNPDINGIRIDFDNNTIPTWKFVTVSATYNEATAPKVSMLYQSATYLLHLVDGPTGQRLRALARNSTGQFANRVTEYQSTNVPSLSIVMSSTTMSGQESEGVAMMDTMYQNGVSMMEGAHNPMLSGSPGFQSAIASNASLTSPTAMSMSMPMTTMSMPVTMVSNMMGGPSPMVMSSLPPAPGIDMSMISDGSGVIYMISGNQPNVDYVSATVDSRLM
ncbi:hypothetical protein MVEG_04484 [Podila verticillata NRRL 6337]|nr:hypothetical protein MVEG_04484 [Podila verticillata NRRL 6337]